MQSGFAVEGLAGEAEVEGEGDAVGVGIGVGGVVAEGVIEERPVPEGDVVDRMDDFARCAEVIGLEIVQLRVAVVFSIADQADRQVVEPVAIDVSRGSEIVQVIDPYYVMTGENI